MKLKRILALVFAVLAVLCIVACGNAETTVTTQTSATTQATTTPHVHIFGEWKIAKEASCEEKGVQTRKCSCGEEERQDILAKGHIEVVDKAVAPSCTETGLTEGKHCSVCNAVIVKQETIAAIGKHSYTSTITTEATCSKDGVKTFTCSMCKDSYTESIAAGHKWSNATCTAPKTCSVCKLTEGDALGHTTDNGTCSRCGSVNIKPIVYTGHGNDVITGVNVPHGLYRVIMTNSGKGHFSVVTYDEKGNYGDLLANTSGAPFIGEALYRDGKINATNGWSFEIDSDSDWSITIEPINKEITSNIKGYGAVVTDFFSGQGLAAVSMTNSGKEHFSVIIYDSQGNYIKLLANDSGSAFSGKAAVTLNASKKYFLVIDSESEWTVDFGFENNITEYYENKTNSGGSSSDSNKWSASDAYNLNSYANNATDNAQTAFDYAIDAISASSTYKVLYNQYAVSYAATTKDYLTRMKTLADSKAELTLTTSNEKYSSLQEKINYAYELCNEIANLKITSSNYTEHQSKILNITMELSLECLGIQKLSTDLMGMFVS